MTSPETPLGGTRGWTAVECGARYGSPAGFPPPKSVMGWMRGHVHCLYHFLESVHRGETRSPSLADGVQLQFVLEKIKESAKTGQWVRL